MLAESSQRIFNNAGGKDSKGKLFGTYNEQYQKQRIKNKNKNIEAINMIFTGDMQKQYIFGVDSRGNYCLGFNALPNNNSKKPNAPQKAEYLEKRFGSFFELTDQEVQQYSKIFTNEFTK
jgi:phage major head subunit gpT-like protein